MHVRPSVLNNIRLTILNKKDNYKKPNKLN